MAQDRDDLSRYFDLYNYTRDGLPDYRSLCLALVQREEEHQKRIEALERKVQALLDAADDLRMYEQEQSE